jgi:hypothetical protein
MTVAIVVNVRARHGSEKLGRTIRRILPSARVTVTHSFDEARAFVADEVVRRKPDVLLSGGGDGTAVALLNELRAHGVKVPAFGLLPLGTGNAWARATGPAGLRASLSALSALGEGECPPLRSFRLVEVEGQVTPFAGTGWDAQILADYKSQIESLPPSLRRVAGGTPGYLRSLFTRTIPRQVFGPARPRVRVINLGEPALALDREGKPVPVPGGGPGAVLYEGPLSVCGAATTEELGLGFRAFPFAHAVPGRMAVRVYAASTAKATLHMPWLWRGAWPLPDDHNWMLTRCRMEFDRAVPFEIGGDLAGERTSVEMSLAPESVSLVDWHRLRKLN